MTLCVVMSFFRQHLLLSRHFVCVDVSCCKIDDSKILKKTSIYYLHMFMNECVQIHALFIFNTSLVHFYDYFTFLIRVSLRLEVSFDNF